MRPGVISRSRLRFLSCMPLLVFIIAVTLVASVVQAVAWPHVASAAGSTAVTPTVPPLPAGINAVPSPSTPIAPAQPAGSFDNLTTSGDGAGSHLSAQSTVVARSMFTTTYRNHDM